MSDIVLPWRHRPGTDMISKLVLQEKPITNVVVEYLVGTRAKDKYRINPTEWINGTRSDVLFTCDEDDPSLPPVLIEVQHVVDDSFMRRLIGYCVSLEKQYGVLPIVMIFPIASIRFDVLNRTRKRKSHPLLTHYSCHPWAQSCFIVDEHALETNLQQPLDPFASLCLFLMRQDSSLLSSPYHSDRTMLLLYRLAQHHVGTTILDHDHVVDDVLRFCNETKARLERLLHLLQDDYHNDNGALSALEDTIMLVDTYREKYEQEPSTVADAHPEPSTVADAHPEPSTVADAHPEPSTVADTHPEPSIVADAHPEPSTVADAHPEPSTVADTHPEPSTVADAHPEPSTVADAHPEPSTARPESSTVAGDKWDFVENRIANLNQGDSISWNAMYQQGKAQGLFSTYSNSASMKRAYYRMKTSKK